MTALDETLTVTILLPMYDDWECARILLRELDRLLAPLCIRAEVIFLDDCSRSQFPPDLVQEELKTIFKVESVRLRRNLGHQRAISIGLSFVHQQRPCDAVLVMDADGEDRPEDVPRLIGKFLEVGADRVIFAERIRRSE